MLGLGCGLGVGSGSAPIWCLVCSNLVGKGEIFPPNRRGASGDGDGILPSLSPFGVDWRI